MSTDSVISTLSAALEQDPHDIGMRVHLADLLLDKGDVEAAHQHYQIVLQKDPANVPALRGAARIAAERGDGEKLAGYDKLLTALTGQSESAGTPSNVSQFPSAGQQKAGAEQAPQQLKAIGTGSDDNVTVGPWEEFEAPITLADVGGMEQVKKRLNLAFLAPLKNPEIRKMYGKSLKGGMLLYGPPGCGKTFIARALAGELGATFLSVGLSDVLDMWLGESERKLHEIFEAARRKAPAVLFFDEIDALGLKRSHLKHSGGRTVINQLLAEMDSVANDNRNVFFLAATNHPWDVDTALRRPGRFDRLSLVLPPDPAARLQILEYHLRDRPAANLDLKQIAQRTEHFSGADLAHLVESTVEYAMYDSIESGTVRPVTMADFEKALPEISPSTRAWFETARNYAMFSNEGGVYDELLDHLRTHKI